MKLVRVGAFGAEKPGVVIDDDHYVDLSSEVRDFDEDFFSSDGVAHLKTVLEWGNCPVRPLGGQRIGAPIARPHQILCIGLNFSDHAVETGQEAPSEPIIFTKSPNTLVGPNDDVVAPLGSTKLDWEVELGVVVGKRAQYLESVEEAEAHIAGYMVVNDVSERAFQLEHGGQWCKGKSSATFNPAGPWLVTPDEMPAMDDLAMWLRVNDTLRQDGSTSTMIFDPAYVVYYLSQFLVLEPGDLINTGTPAGVGMAQRPQVWLQAGDVVELGIEGLGRQRQRVVDAAELRARESVGV